MSLNQMIKSSVRCVKCGAGLGQCGCWTKCHECGCMFETGKKCRRCAGDDTPTVIAASTPRRRKRPTPRKEMSEQKLPDWMAGLTHKDWLFDGGRCSLEQWENLDWQKAYVDLGPSVAGNLGPYWHVPHSDGDTVHRLYPKLLQTKWLNVVRQAATEYAARFMDQSTGRSVK